MAAELYHIAVAVHLPAADGQEIWVENIHDSVALVDALDAHRVMEVAEDRGQRLSTLKKQYEDAMGEFERCRAKLERYITTMERQ